MFLYRPVGLEELLLMFESGMKAFPPRLPEQPFFYPVVNEGYAEQIAREWNTKTHSLAGYVTRFFVNDTYTASFPVKTVGGREHQELWVPAERLDEFNSQIEGLISVIDAHFGEGFRGYIPQHFSLKGRDAAAQLVALKGIFDYSLMDFHGEIAANKEAIFLHFPFWQLRTFASEGLADPAREVLLNGIRKAWSQVSPAIPLSDLPRQTSR